MAEGQSTSGTISAQLSTHMSLAFNNFQQNVAEGQAITHQSTEKSNLTYLDILNEHADSILTMLELLEAKYQVLRGMSQYLIVVED